MTSHVTQAPAEAPHADPTDSEPSPDTPASEASAARKPGIPAFSFPFSPSTYATGKKDDQPWHQKGNKSNHDQRPGLAPKGSSKSMGKR